jgi:uncharacterized membrane protein YsdA (DUF1294 family)/cold shock CspA family protein
VRHQGKLTDWTDDKGFGFVTPDDGGPRVFVHIKSFANRQRRPTGNELVTYELKFDTRGRSQGMDVVFVGDPSPSASVDVPGPGLRAFLFASAFIALLLGSVASGRLPLAIAIVYAAASCAAFLAYSIDKFASRRGGRRTPESTLHFFSIVGGWPGAMLAQRVFRHKTQKLSFQVVFWVTVLLNCAAFGWLLWPAGFRALKVWISGA